MIPPLVAIFASPLAVLLLFRLFPPRAALVWTLLLGYLFLPTKVGFNLPMLPRLDKDTVPALAALACLIYLGPRLSQDPAGAPQPGWVPRDRLIRIFILALLAGTFLTVLTNRDALVYGSTRLPGLKPYDGLSSILSTLMMLLPMLLARKYLASVASQKLILFGLCIAGLIYTLPIIYELVMSPQLNRIVYGFFPHAWNQHIRDGGYRPLVFLHHGLWLGIFMCVSVLAAGGYARITEDGPAKTYYFAATFWLLIILIACKSLGAIGITLLFLPLVLLAHMRLQLLIAAVIAGTILLYPALRGAGVIPVDRAVQIAASIDPIRSRSLNYRFTNENILLKKANNRPLFGWGGWGRSRVFDRDGQDISTTDGLWVIIVGERGWIGYLARFGLLCAPILILAFRRREEGLSPTTAVLALVLTGNLIDLIPNAGLTPVTWLLAGSLIGQLERRTAEVTASAPTGGTRRRMRLTRFEHSPQPPSAPPTRRQLSPPRHREDSNAV